MRRSNSPALANRCVGFGTPVERDETRLHEARDAEHQALVRDERLVAIDRNGLPGRLILFSNPRPLPLVRMPVVVANQR